MAGQPGLPRKWNTCGAWILRSVCAAPDKPGAGFCVVVFRRIGSPAGTSEFRVMESCQLYMPGDCRVLSAEHADVKFGITGKDILNPAAGDLEPEPDVADSVILRGQGDFAGKPVRHHVLQHGGIVPAGIEGIQVLTEVGLPL